MKQIIVEKNIPVNNNELADKNRKLLDEKQIFTIKQYIQWNIIRQWFLYYPHGLSLLKTVWSFADNIKKLYSAVKLNSGI